MTDPSSLPGRSFDAAVGEYELGRPGYSRAALHWCLPPEPGLVLDLGAGTGELAAGLLALRCRVLRRFAHRQPADSRVLVANAASRSPLLRLAAADGAAALSAVRALALAARFAIPYQRVAWRPRRLAR